MGSTDPRRVNFSPQLARPCDDGAARHIAARALKQPLNPVNLKPPLNDNGTTAPPTTPSHPLPPSIRSPPLARSILAQGADPVSRCPTRISRH